MRYGLIGKTLVHSYSKEIHEALGKYTYDLFSLPPEKLSGFIDSFDFGGLNVTIPYKQDVMPLCDEISELAEAIGAVNTLYIREPGHKLVGHNTDYEGFLYAAKRAGIDFDGKTVLVLGTGGTSLTVRKAVSDRGATKIFLASRSAGKASAPDGGKTSNHQQSINADSASSQRPTPVHRLTYGELSSVADSINVIVNTTPVGTYPNNLQSIISLADFPLCDSVIDVIYNPFKTKLLMEAEQGGLKYSNGLPMLVAQATAATGYFLGTPGAFYGENERIISQMESRMRNIVLIGMPGCGKSTIGRLLSQITGKTLVDTDSETEKSAKMSIPDIFATHGEKRFRDMESETVSRLGKKRGLIIATGGGAILREENVAALRQNGLVVHITRPVAGLPTKGRPLSKDRSALMKMEKERMPLYSAAADITFDNSKGMTEKELRKAVGKILDK